MHRKNIKDGITNISNKQFIDGCLLRQLHAWNKLFVSLENKIILNYKKNHIDYFKESNLLKKKLVYLLYVLSCSSISKSICCLIKRSFSLNF